MFKIRTPHHIQSERPTPYQNQKNPPSENEVSSSDTTIDEEVPPGGKKPRAKRGTGLAAQRQTESMKKIRSTLILLFSGSAGMLRMLGNLSGNDALTADSHVFSPINAITGNANDSVHQLIEAILKLAEQDKNVRDMLLSLGNGSAYTNVVVAALPMVIAVLANHNLIPNLFKMAPVETLPNAATG